MLRDPDSRGPAYTVPASDSDTARVADAGANAARAAEPPVDDFVTDEQNQVVDVLVIDACKRLGLTAPDLRATIKADTIWAIHQRRALKHREPTHAEIAALIHKQANALFQTKTKTK